MARIALIVTLVLLIGTGILSFLTKSKMEERAAQLTSTENQLNLTKQDLNKSKADLKTAQDAQAKAEADEATAKNDLATAKSNLDAATKQVTDDKAQIADLNSQIDKLKTQKTPTTVAGGPSVDDMNKLNDQLKDAKIQIAELTQVEGTLKNQAKDATARADDLAEQVKRYQSHIVKNGLEGEILAVNHDWNFVVLSIGDRQGAVTNAEMVITRGASQIGKARITEVEPSTSVADIIPGSLGRGVSIQPGDHVIFPGN